MNLQRQKSQSSPLSLSSAGNFNPNRMTLSPTNTVGPATPKKSVGKLLSPSVRSMEDVTVNNVEGTTAATAANSFFLLGMRDDHSLKAIYLMQSRLSKYSGC